MAVSHKNLSRWYLEAGQSLDAGLNLAEALQNASGVPKKDSGAMAMKLHSGASFDSVLREAPAWLPATDRMILSAAARSGRAPDTFRKLSLRHKASAENLAKVAMSILYPLFIIHFAIFLLPIMTLVQFQDTGSVTFNVAGYLKESLSLLAALWLIVGAIAFLVRIRSPVLRMVMNLMPGIRGYLKAGENE